MKTKQQAKRHISYSPAKCRTEQLYRISRGNIEVGDFSLGTDTYVVWLTEQRIGEPPRQSIEIPRRIFNKFIRWYQRPQKAIRQDKSF